MHYIISSKIEQLVKDAVEAVYKISIDDVLVERPKNEEWGDYATNVSLVLSKQVEHSSIEIANKLYYEIIQSSSYNKLDNFSFDLFDEIYVAAPGFINFRLSNAWLLYVLFEITNNPDSYGTQQKFKEKFENKRIALEHSNVNPNKAAHVGHLRNACIGQFLERIYEYFGASVEVQYIDNDLGVQVSTSLLGILEIQDLDPNDYVKYDHYAWDVYSKISQKLHDEPDLKTKLEELQKKLENRNESVSLQQEELATKILVEQLKTFQKLGFDYDVIIRERDIVDLNIWTEAFEKLRKSNSVYLSTDGPSKGCWLVKMNPTVTELSDQNKKEDSMAVTNVAQNTGEKVTIEEDKIIVRSNGIPNYTGKDIAYHMWKFGLIGKDFYYKKFDNKTQDKDLYITTSNESDSNVDKSVSFSNVDYVLNVVDVKQTYALEAVRRSLESLGYKEKSQNMIHINYGFVYLSPETAKTMGIDTSDGKKMYAMSGRKGWGVKIDDFINIVENTIVEEFGMFEALNAIRNGAIKFEMLKYNTFQDLIFDLNNATSIQGYSGPYIQYTYARARSVLRNYTGNTNDFTAKQEELLYYFSNQSKDLNAKEKLVLRHLQNFDLILKQCAEDFAPNTLCNYLYELSQKFNTFYNDVPILATKDKDTKLMRLILTHSVVKVLSKGLYLLGIESPERV